MTRIAAITYQTRHLKTQQILMSLFDQGHRGIDVFALPFVQRPGREVLLQHRPDMNTGAHSADVAKELGYNYIPVKNADEIAPDYDAQDALVIVGAGILPGELVSRVRTVNAHPGLIPAVRGLDSFKWAILDQAPLGVTIHLVDAEVDAGKVLASVRTPVHKNDTIEDLARRHYDLEIQLLSDFMRYLEDPMPKDTTLKERPARLRMPKDTEIEMLKFFDSFKEKYAES